MGKFNSELEELYSLSMDFVSIVENMYNDGEISLEEYEVLTQKKLYFINSITEKVH